MTRQERNELKITRNVFVWLVLSGIALVWTVSYSMPIPQLLLGAILYVCISLKLLLPVVKRRNANIIIICVCICTLALCSINLSRTWHQHVMQNQYHDEIEQSETIIYPVFPLK